MADAATIRMVVIRHQRDQATAGFGIDITRCSEEDVPVSMQRYIAAPAGDARH